MTSDPQIINTLEEVYTVEKLKISPDIGFIWSMELFIETLSHTIDKIMSIIISHRFSDS
ncbi:hypothetical protein AYI69_g10332, partial [Smittium culicis]